jgi:hypothetical protein
MVGLERTVVALVWSEDFVISSSTVTTSFIGFGALNALANLISRSLSDHWGRRPVPLLG